MCCTQMVAIANIWVASLDLTETHQPYQLCTAYNTLSEFKNRYVSHIRDVEF